MGDYIFISVLAFIWVIFASISDLRTREVPNWLSFSLISFILAYRLFLSITNNDYYFFLVGLMGAGVGFLLALAFYYGKVFAGGDAKLLIGFGALMPVMDVGSMIMQVITFIFILFLSGSVYSLVFSFYLVLKQPKKYWKNFVKETSKQKGLIYIGAIFGIIFLGAFSFSSFGFAGSGFFILLPFLYTYLKALENVCFIKKISPEFLTEGDWILSDVRVGNKIIRKSVHGLSFREILMLRKANKSVMVRDGIPFVPAFLISLAIMVSFWVSSGSGWVDSALSLI